MRWRERFRNERGELAPYVPRRTREGDLGYGFNTGEYPGLAKAADELADIRNSRVKRWRLRLRSMKY
jgi:hypothetical protein